MPSPSKLVFAARLYPAVHKPDFSLPLMSVPTAFPSLEHYGTES